jgi:hypothetical protein
MTPKEEKAYIGGGGSVNGTPLYLWEYGGNYNQKFRLVEVKE